MAAALDLRVLLPRAIAESAVPLPPAVHVAEVIEPAVGTETILLVEDESGVREVLRTFLEGAGYVVHEAGSGAEAERLCRELGHIDLLLSDVVIPDVNGPELALRLRAMVPGLKTLLISGYPADALSQAGIEADARYLPKPFSRAVLLRQVRDALQS